MAVTQVPYGTSTGVIGTAQMGPFIPEVWGTEIVARYKSELVVCNLARTISFAGKKGDTLRLPAPSRGRAARKVAGADVTIQRDTESDIVISLSEHFEYSRLIEDIVAVQANPEYRAFYTDDASFALASEKDTALIALGRSANAGAGTAAYANAFVAGDGNTLYTGANQTAITAAGIRRSVQRMDDNFLPLNGRFFLLPPVGRSVLNGIAEFTAHQFVGESASQNTIRNGLIGDLYGVPVYVSPLADTATGGARIGMFGHRESLVLIEQMNVRTQTQYKQEKLATLFTADTLYGVKNIRDGSDPDIGSGLFVMAMPA